MERGGSLVATYETALYDEMGAKRADFGLADLFGVSYKGHAKGPMRNSYLQLRDDPRTGKRHPILEGLAEAPRIIHGTFRLDVTPRREFPHAPLTLIPSYPDLPMEKVYPRVAKTDIAEVYLREIGSARDRLLPVGYRPHFLGGPER